MCGPDRESVPSGPARSIDVVAQQRGRPQGDRCTAIATRRARVKTLRLSGQSFQSIADDVGVSKKQVMNDWAELVKHDAEAAAYAEESARRKTAEEEVRLDRIRRSAAAYRAGGSGPENAARERVSEQTAWRDLKKALRLGILDVPIRSPGRRRGVRYSVPPGVGAAISAAKRLFHSSPAGARWRYAASIRMHGWWHDGVGAPPVVVDRRGNLPGVRWTANTVRRWKGAWGSRAAKKGPGRPRGYTDKHVQLAREFRRRDPGIGRERLSKLLGVKPKQARAILANLNGVKPQS